MSFYFPLFVLLSGYNLIGSLFVYLISLFVIVRGVFRGVRLSGFMVACFVFGVFLFAGSARLEEFNLIYFIRFFGVIFSLIFLIFLSPLKIDFSSRPVIYIAVIQSVFIFSISLYLLSSDFNTWQSIRIFVKDRGFGDIWTTDGYYYRVQLRGNPLIMVGWLSQLILIGFNNVKDKFSFAILSVGLVVAGNLTFLFAAFLAIFIYCIVYKKFFILLCFCFFLVSALGLGFLDEIIFVLVRKFSGAQSSMGARFEQINVIVRAIFLEGYYFHGAGAGAPYPLGRFGDGGWRTISQYIEVQLFLYFYKFGFFSGLLLTVCVYFSVFLFEFRVGLFIFCYLVSSVTNPYFLDANHLLIMLIAHGFVHSKFRARNGKF